MAFISKGVNQKTEQEKRSSKPPSEELRVLKYREHYKKIYSEDDIDKTGLYKIETESIDWIVTWCERILTQRIKEYPYWINYPIIWSDHQKAEEWVNEGCIGELQEGLGNLQVGFTREYLKEL